jgi:sugar transferase (PEP-CTERM system associated)
VFDERSTFCPNETGTKASTPLFEQRVRWFERSYRKPLIRVGGRYVARGVLVLAATETLMILLALLAATFTRFFSLAGAQDYLGQTQTWLRLMLVIVLCQLAQYYSDLYDLQEMGSRTLQSIRVVRAAGITLLVLSFLYYAFPLLRLEPGIAAIASFLIPILILAQRFFLNEGRALRQPLERLLIVGTGQQGINLAQEILRRPGLQYKVVGFLDANAEGLGRPLASPGIVGGLSQLQEIVLRDRIDRVVISLDQRRGILPIRDLAALKVQGLPIEEAHSVFEKITGRIMLEQLRPSWLLFSEGFRKSRFVLAAKRMTDVVVSLIVIALASPALLLTAIAVLIDSGRPILFRQERVGLGGRPFQILKFRSMRQGSEKGTPSWTAEGDPRITRVGNFIRKYRLDELPQLFNVLRGEMSLIGPRPEVPYFCELLEREIPLFNQRHCVRPGVSGWAQVKYKYGASLEEAKIKFEFDLFYIKHLSLALDLSIVFQTLRVVLLGKGAK